MRTLTTTLEVAQKKASREPYVKVEAKNMTSGVVRLDWTRLYAGAEPDCFHAVAMPGDGSLVRARITPPADSRKLYIQRVTTPDPASDFTSWTYTGEYNALVAAAAALGAEASVFWVKSDRAIYQLKSTDNGASWEPPVLIGYTSTTTVNGLAAAYKPGGDIALFYTDQATLYVIKRTSGTWGAAAAWDKSTGELSGAACIFSGDWDLALTGRDSSGNFKLWGLVFGDGGDVTADAWSSLKELASAPSDGDYEYRQPFLGKPDVFRLFFVEKFTGSEACNRPCWSHTVAGTKFVDNLWREPVPFNFTSEYGLAPAHSGDFAWLANPAGVWRAGLAAQTFDLSKDVVRAEELLAPGSGKLTIELRNDAGQYSSPGAGSLAILNTGCQLDFSLGYRTAAGDEISAGPSFSLEAYEHTSAGGRAALRLHALDGWSSLKAWRARHQFRWNKSSSDFTVKDIMSFVLARSGLKLAVKSESEVVTGFHPDFAINPGQTGDEVIARLLSFVPDMLFIEGEKAYLVDPQTSDASVYSYGTAHPVREGAYRRGAWALNRVLVGGVDETGDAVSAESFAWDEVVRLYDRLRQVEDRNIDTVETARQRGQAYLREAEVAAASGFILTGVNCAQQLYDVIDITDGRAGLSAAKRRVLGIKLDYYPGRGEYDQRLELGMV